MDSLLVPEHCLSPSNFWHKYLETKPWDQWLNHSSNKFCSRSHYHCLWLLKRNKWHLLRIQLSMLDFKLIITMNSTLNLNFQSLSKSFAVWRWVTEDNWDIQFIWQIIWTQLDKICSRLKDKINAQRLYFTHLEIWVINVSTAKQKKLMNLCSKFLKDLYILH